MKMKRDGKGLKIRGAAAGRGKIIVAVVLLLAVCACAPRIDRRDYYVVCNESHSQLSQWVTRLVRARWRLEGGLSMVALRSGEIQYCQALSDGD